MTSTAVAALALRPKLSPEQFIDKVNSVMSHTGIRLGRTDVRTSAITTKPMLALFAKKGKDPSGQENWVLIAIIHCLHDQLTVEFEDGTKEFEKRALTFLAGYTRLYLDEAPASLHPTHAFRPNQGGFAPSPRHYWASEY